MLPVLMMSLILLSVQSVLSQVSIAKLEDVLNRDLSDACRKLLHTVIEREKKSLNDLIIGPYSRLRRNADSKTYFTDWITFQDLIDIKELDEHCIDELNDIYQRENKLFKDIILEHNKIWSDVEKEDIISKVPSLIENYRELPGEHLESIKIILKRHNTNINDLFDGSQKRWRRRADQFQAMLEDISFEEMMDNFWKDSMHLVL